MWTLSINSYLTEKFDVRGVNTKEELYRELKGRNVNITITSATKDKLSGTKDLKRFTMTYSRVDPHKHASC